MPRLVLFVPCDRVIFGFGDMSASLIIILQDLQIANPPIVSPIVFHHFSVFSQWYKLESDEGKTFEQRIALTYGEEKPLLENIATFQMTQQWHRISANFQAFPPLKPVEYALTLSVREQGNSQWPSPIASYPINVKQAPQVPTAVN
jgi:hypothetical protein